MYSIYHDTRRYSCTMLYTNVCLYVYKSVFKYTDPYEWKSMKSVFVCNFCKRNVLHLKHKQLFLPLRFFLSFFWLTL